jgi:lipopolysaccharide export system protein LptA
MSTRCPDLLARSMKDFARILVLFMSLSTALTQALPDDRDKPMRITADKAERDDVNGVTIYRGNVVLIQGTLKLESETLTIFQTDEEPSKIIAEGKPAKMQQRPKLDKAMMYANARVITYYKSEERVHLQTDGYVEQDGRVVNGDSIDYFIEKELTKATSDPKRKDDRVVVVIPPSELKKEDDSGATESE